MNEKGNKGITLISLIITVIVMLILIAVSVQILIDSDLIGTSEKTADLYQTEADKESNLSVSDIGVENGSTLEEYYNKAQQVICIHNYVDGVCIECGKEKSAEDEETSLPEDLKVGDYVNYTPAGTAYTTSYEVLTNYSGYSSVQTVYLQETEWRVLNINEDGTVDLISDASLYIGSTSGNTTQLKYEGMRGYGNMVYLLNDLCNTLYGSGVGATGARSLNVEDIQDKMDTSVWSWEDYVSNQGYTYGETETYTSSSKRYYPIRWAEETTAVVNGSSTGGTLGPSDSGTLIPSTDVSYLKASSSITVTQTYWGLTMSTSNFIDYIYYELFINNGSNYASYLLATRFAYLYDDGAGSGFGLFRMYEKVVSGGDCVDSTLENLWRQSGLRPLVKLDKDIKLSLESYDGEFAYWNIE